MILLANTLPGMAQLPVIKATTVHIPVVLGATLLGPLAGSISGGVFDVCSMMSNTTAPTLLSFAFSPLMNMAGIQGAAKAVWISMGCKVLIGLISGWLWIFLKKYRVNIMIALPITGLTGAMTNTVFIMGSIYSLLVKEYAAVKGVAIDIVWGLVLGTVTASGTPEVITAAVLVALIGRVLLKVVK